MDPMFMKSIWEVDRSLPYTLEDLLVRIRRDGFDGTELFLRSLDTGPDDTKRLHRQHGLGMIAAIVTDGQTASDHERSLREQVEDAVRFEPMMINCHTGRDIFSFDDNLGLFEVALELEDAHGVAICHETHRGRAMFTAPITRRYLEAVPELRLTADVSHWMVVHASDLHDQWENVELAIQRSDHIHARVGFEHGPQVSDPSAPEVSAHWDNHLAIWRAIAERMRAEGGQVTITPEFGPPPYAPTLPYTGQPTVDVWKVNVEVRKRLARELATLGT